MRRFSSYGPVNSNVHYYAPRKELIQEARTRLLGQSPNEGGHYITIWAPRQCGKTWIMQEVLKTLDTGENVYSVYLGLEHLKDVKDISQIFNYLFKEISRQSNVAIPPINSLSTFQEFFTKDILKKPLILILDEFDALADEVINSIVSIFSNIYIQRREELNKKPEDQWYRLHGLALIGVRSVLGIENQSGSPFNIQQSLHIPNLTYQEVEGMFQWYQKESGQVIEKDVIRRLYEETCGQPGLTCWFGELLTETYNPGKDKPVTPETFEEVYAAAIKILPNNNILNIISKAAAEPYKQTVLELFKTTRKIEFSYDNKQLNYLYMNGVIDHEKHQRTEYYVKFSSPFVQKRLFNYFSEELFPHMGKLHEPFENLDDTITETTLNPVNLLKRFKDYLQKNRGWLLKDAPRRSDLRIFEAVYHFSLYSFLDDFLEDWGAKIYPEFPTGNGKIDLLILHAGKRFAVELMSYTNQRNYRLALEQAAQYAGQMQLDEIFLAFFVESIDDETRQRYETHFKNKDTGYSVIPVFIETGV